ncbi:MAG: BF3164 family lipoprotein [Bacteroidota bacterium]
MKNKLLTITIILIAIIISYSCQNSTKEKEISEFPVKIDLKGSKPQFDNELGIHLSKIKILDSLIIASVSYRNAGDDYLYFFNKSTYEPILSTGKRGKGPKELTNPIRFLINHKKKCLWVFDLGKRKIWEFNIDSLIKYPNYKPHQYMDISTEMGMVYELTSLGDTIVMGDGKGNSLVKFAFNDGKTIKDYGTEHVKKGNKSERAYSKTLRKKMCVNEEHNRLILGYRYYNRLSVLNNKGELLWSITGKDKFKPRFKGLSPTDSKVAYFTTVSFDNYILGLYSGRKVGEIEGGKLNPIYAETIHVFNIDGEVLGKLNLDREIYFMALDRENNKIIGFEPDEDNPFVIYNLPIDKLKK